MSTRAQKIRLGVFMILSVLLFLGSVGTLAGIKLLNPRDRYYVRFTESVSGLEVGSSVKMKGVRVGQVERIGIGSDVESVQVTLALNPGTPITVDTEAIMTAIGITGLQFIELTGGTARSKKIPPNTPKSLIKPGSSTLRTLTGKAESIAIKMEAALNNVLAFTNEASRTRVARLLEDADKLAVEATGAIRENRPRLEKIFTNLDTATKVLERSARSLSKLVRDNRGNVEQTLVALGNAARAIDRAASGLRINPTLKAVANASKAIKKRADNPNIDKLIAALNRSTSRIDAVSAELTSVIRQRNRQLAGIMHTLARASDYLKDFARAVKERPSLLLRGETLKEKRVP